MNRRRMMLPASGGGLRYPLVQGTHEFVDGKSSITVEGSHVKIVDTSRTLREWYINILDINENGNVISSNLNMQYKTPKFTLHNGDKCYLRIYNIKFSQDGFYFSFNFKRANSAVSLDFNQSGNQDTKEDFVANVTMGEDEQVGSFFIYKTSSLVNMTFEFDVEFYVNEERWF